MSCQAGAGSNTYLVPEVEAVPQSRVLQVTDKKRASFNKTGMLPMVAMLRQLGGVGKRTSTAKELLSWRSRETEQDLAHKPHTRHLGVIQALQFANYEVLLVDTWYQGGCGWRLL